MASEKAEDKLSENEALLRHTQGLAHVGGWELDLADLENIESNILRWTDETFRIFGYEPGEVEVSNELFFSHVHPHDREAILEAVVAALHEKKPYEIIHRINRADGEERIICAWADIVRSEEGRPLQLVGACQDVTKRRQAEESLRAYNRQFRALLDAAPLGVFMVDADFRIRHVNPVALAVFGKIPGGVVERNFDRVIHMIWEKEHADDVVNAFRHTLETGEPYFVDECVEFRIDRKVMEYYEWQISRIVLSDGSYGVVCYFRDISSQVQVRIAIAEMRDKAEAANHAKSEFLANMSHEIRTPMNAVVGLSSLLAMDETLSAEQKEMVNTLQISAESLLGLINDLLDIAKIETNRIDLEHIPFTLGTIFKEVCDMLSVKAQEKGITLTCIPSPLDSRRFMGDPLRIRQVLMNLIGNAVKFTEKGGVDISISSSPHENPAYSCVHITVSDTGIGIAPEKLEGIFEKFAQGDTSITRKYGGTGLGLAISKSLAEIMGGSITAKSEDGKGAQFTLHLPLELANGHRMLSSKDKEPKMPSPQKVHGHVLLVEDYKPNVLVATHMIEGLGYVCDTAVNGEEALEKIRADRDRYRAVLMDVQMPDMDGFEATKIIREEEKAKNLTRLPVIAMTAYAMQGDKERCLAAGMDRYISKPFQPRELEAILKECSDNISAMEEAAES